MAYKDPIKQKEYRKEYYQKNKDRITEKHKNYRNENQEKLKEKKKEYYEQNKEQIKEKKREYYKQNKDRAKEYGKNYRSENKEKIKEKQREYYEQNKERYYQQNNQHTKIENYVSRLSANNHYQLWDPEQDEILVKLYRRGSSYKEIANKLSRTIYSINSRLQKLHKLGKL